MLFRGFRKVLLRTMGLDDTPFSSGRGAAERPLTFASWPGLVGFGSANYPDMPLVVY